VAEAELAFMAELCACHADDTLLSVQRELTETGVRERFLVIGGQPARRRMAAGRQDAKGR